MKIHCRYARVPVQLSIIFHLYLQDQDGEDDKGDSPKGDDDDDDGNDSVNDGDDDDRKGMYCI